MLVDPELLHKTPPAFQQYVAKFFVEKQVLGRKVLVASTTISNGHYGGKGIAPSHSVDLMRFTEGLNKGESLSDWIRKAEGKCLWQFYGVNEHSDCGACDDD